MALAPVLGSYSFPVHDISVIGGYLSAGGHAAMNESVAVKHEPSS